jgi:16S rRNA (uracil1498-N3)-methyltransferase
MDLFYDSDIAETLILNAQESRHCVSVLRHKAGDVISVSDGKGTFFECMITEAHPKHCKVEIVANQTHEKRKFNLHIAIAPTKNIDRTEWFAEKATEIGIESVTLLRCEHSERKKVRLNRLEKILVAASKQSLKAYKPKLADLIKFKEFVDNNRNAGYIAHCISSNLPHFKTVYTSGEDATLLIGPEGDFSPEEVDYALKKGFKEISLGNSRLRTETAGVIACAMFNLIND